MFPAADFLKHLSLRMRSDKWTDENRICEVVQRCIGLAVYTVEEDEWSNITNWK
ncbi:hypothetical protein SK128_009068, partial [Halocaridina rubra]